MISFHMYVAVQPGLCWNWLGIPKQVFSLYVFAGNDANTYSLMLSTKT